MSDCWTTRWDSLGQFEFKTRPQRWRMASDRDALLLLQRQWKQLTWVRTKDGLALEKRTGKFFVREDLVRVFRVGFLRKAAPECVGKIFFVYRVTVQKMEAGQQVAF